MYFIFVVISYSEPGCLNILDFLQICQKIHDFLRNSMALGVHHQGQMILVTPLPLGYGKIAIESEVLWYPQNILKLFTSS